MHALGESPIRADRRAADAHRPPARPRHSATATDVSGSLTPSQGPCIARSPMDQQPTMASASFNTPLWQRGASTPTTYAGGPSSSTPGGLAVADDEPVGFEGHPQIQVGKPEKAWRCVLAFPRWLRGGGGGGVPSELSVGLTEGCGCAALLPNPAPLSWRRYEMRREAQLILPNLYLGGYQSSRTVDGLNALGVTHVCVPVPRCSSSSGAPLRRTLRLTRCLLGRLSVRSASACAKRPRSCSSSRASPIYSSTSCLKWPTARSVKSGARKRIRYAHVLTHALPPPCSLAPPPPPFDTLLLSGPEPDPALPLDV